MQFFADERLAARLEGLAAREMQRFVDTARAVDPYSDAAMLQIAGGTAAYLGEGSPVNQALGLGMGHAVSPDEIEGLESFYRERGTRGLVVSCPLAHPTLVQVLSSQGWTVEGFENVLVRECSNLNDVQGQQSDDETVEVIEVEDDEHRAVWAHVAAIAFAAPLEPNPAQLALARVVAARPHARLLLGLVDGRPAGTGEVFIDDGVAWLSADATLPQFRRRGVQSALQGARLRIGAEEGCALAVSEALPGSDSQRNMERIGFAVAYTRVDFLSPSSTETGA